MRVYFLFINKRKSIAQTRYKRGKKKGKFKKRTEFGQESVFKAHTIKVPPRPFLVLSDQALDEIITEIRKEIH